MLRIQHLFWFDSRVCGTKRRVKMVEVENSMEKMVEKRLSGDELGGLWRFKPWLRVGDEEKR